MWRWLIVFIAQVCRSNHLLAYATIIFTEWFSIITRQFGRWRSFTSLGVVIAYWYILYYCKIECNLQWKDPEKQWITVLIFNGSTPSRKTVLQCWKNCRILECKAFTFLLFTFLLFTFVPTSKNSIHFTRLQIKFIVSRGVVSNKKEVGSLHERRKADSWWKFLKLQHVQISS